jgi:hypothetical protein
MSRFYELYTTPRWRKACRKICRNLPAHGWSPATEDRRHQRPRITPAPGPDVDGVQKVGEMAIERMSSRARSRE